MSSVGQSKRGRACSKDGSSERGASMIEFALVAPLFFLVLFGGIEVGLMFRSHLAVEDMSRNAARVASIQRDNPDADIAILGVIDELTAGLQGEVNKVIIFHAPTLNDGLPPSCIDANGQPISIANLCNSYGDNFREVVAGVIAVETALADAERQEWMNLGIYVEFTHPFATGFLDPIQLTAEAVEVVELDT